MPDKSFWGVVGAVLTLAFFGILHAFGVPIFRYLGLLVVLAVMVGIAYVSGKAMRIFMIVVIVLFIAGSAWIEVQNSFENAPPPVVIDNSVDIYPLPTDDPTGTTEWLKEKVEIEPNEGAGKVFGVAWLASFSAFWVFFGIAWLIAHLPIQSLRRIEIPIFVVFFVLWLGISIWAIASPVNRPGMDEHTANALTIQWTLGFAQNVWWAAVLSAISWGISAVVAGAERTKWNWLILAASAATWLLMQLFTLTIDPTTVAWTICSNQLLDSGITNSLCQEAFASGKVAAWAASMTWAWLWALIKKIVIG